jgi:hypothetical protein
MLEGGCEWTAFTNTRDSLNPPSREALPRLTTRRDQSLLLYDAAGPLGTSGM